MGLIPISQLRAAAADFEAYLQKTTDKAEQERVTAYLSAVRSALAAETEDARRVYYGVTEYLDGEAERAYKTCASAHGRLKPGAADEVAMLYMARAMEAMKKPYPAYEKYEEFLRAYPTSRYAREAVAAELRIARQLKQAGSAKVVTVLESVSAHDPLGPLAPDAAMALADWHFDEKDYAEASEAYQTVLEQYGRSAHVAAARFKHAVCLRRLAERYAHPGDALEQAREDLQYYLQEYPRGEFVAEAKRLLAEVRGRQAQELWTIAEFYRRQKRPGALGLYLRRIVRDYPDTPWKVKAEDALRALAPPAPSETPAAPPKEAGHAS